MLVVVLCIMVGILILLPVNIGFDYIDDGDRILVAILGVIGNKMVDVFNEISALVLSHMGLRRLIILVIDLLVMRMLLLVTEL